MDFPLVIHDERVELVGHTLNDNARLCPFAVNTGLQYGLVLRELSREVSEAGEPVGIVGLGRHGQALSHGVAVLWPASHV